MWLEFLPYDVKRIFVLIALIFISILTRTSKLNTLVTKLQEYLAYLSDEESSAPDPDDSNGKSPQARIYNNWVIVDQW